MLSARSALVLATLSTVAMSCGYTSEGSGTETMEATLFLRFTSTTEALTTGEIQLRYPGGEAVTGATIELTNGDNDQVVATFIESEASGESGTYRTSFEGYVRKIALKASYGGDLIEAKLEGPAEHIIASPANGTVYGRTELGDSVEVTWEANDGLRADEVVVEFEESGFVSTLTDDPGKLSIPAERIEDGINTISVVRRNLTPLAGGLGTSIFALEYEVVNTIQYNP